MEAQIMKKTTFSRKNDSVDFRQKIDYFKNMVDPRCLIENLGFTVSRETPKEIRSSCIIHKGDNKTAFRFNKERRTWVCFTHRCHEIFGNDIIGLVKACNSVDFIGAVKYLESIVGTIDNPSSILLKFRQEKEANDFISSVEGNKHIIKESNSIVNEECLKQFKKFRSNRFLKDGFKKETLDYFEVAGGHVDSVGLVRDLIPIRSEYDDLLAYSMRDIRDNLDKEEMDYKYIITSGFIKDKVLYNLNNAKKHTKDKLLIVVEGFKSVWRLYEYGINNVVASMGSEVTQGQRNLLCSYAIKGAVIFFDNDLAGIEGAIKSVEQLKNKIEFVVPIFITDVDSNGKGLDPSDLSKEKIYNYLRLYI
jgi:DNA primase